MALRPLVDLGLAGVLMLALAPVQAAKTIYCCDVGGQPVCSDMLPPACYGQAYREIGPQGVIRRKVPPPPSAEEIARRNAEAERRKEAEAGAAKSRRLDQALLETYQNVDDLDRRRDRALTEADRSLDDLRAREEDLMQRRKRILPDADGKRGQPVTREQAEALRDVDSELAAHRSVIAAKVSEREAIRQRYEADRERYLELTSSARPAQR